VSLLLTYMRLCKNCDYYRVVEWANWPDHSIAFDKIEKYFGWTYGPSTHNDVKKEHQIHTMLLLATQGHLKKEWFLTKAHYVQGYLKNFYHEEVPWSSWFFKSLSVPASILEIIMWAGCLTMG
jgi:hypothetical protein